MSELSAFRPVPSLVGGGLLVAALLAGAAGPAALAVIHFPIAGRLRIVAIPQTIIALRGTGRSRDRGRRHGSGKEHSDGGRSDKRKLPELGKKSATVLLDVA